MSFTGSNPVSITNLKQIIMEWYDYQNEYPENECRYCGAACEKTYCDKQCERADED